MTNEERESLIEAGKREYALQAIAQRLSEHLGRPVETADVVAAVDEAIGQVAALKGELRDRWDRQHDDEHDAFWERE